MAEKPTGATGRRDVDKYLAALPPEVRDTLEKLRQTIRAVAPDAEECISYQMPTFKQQGRAVVGFAAFKDHCSLFPYSDEVFESFGDELAAYQTSKGTIRFPIVKPLPAALVRKIVKARLSVIQSGGK